jgi:hypothetical protein
VIRVLPLAFVLVASCGMIPGPGIAVLRDGGTIVAWRPAAAGDSWTPPGSAAYVNEGWWALVGDPVVTTPGATVPPFPYGEVVTASQTDLDGDGRAEVVISYRHPVRSVAWDQGPLATDSAGRSAHLGVVTADGTPVWLARRIPHPIGAIAACGEHIALAYSEFETDVVVATTAATWIGFGFTVAVELPGPGRIGCADVDGDGTADPVVIDR